MNFSPVPLDDDLREFWADVKQFFDEHMTPEVAAHEAATGDGFYEPIYLAMGDRGWLAPTWPVEDGGAGLDPVRARILLNELWLRRVPDVLRFTCILMAESLKRWVQPEMRDEIVRGIGTGRLRLAQAITEPDSGSDAASARTTAVRDGDEWIIDGAKMFTSHAHNCHLAFALVRTNREATKHRGLSALLIPLDQPGVEIQPIHTLGNERSNMVYFNGARTPDLYRLGDVDQGWTVINTVLTDEHGMGSYQDVTAKFMYSMHLRQTLEAATEWAATPDAFGQRPIDDAAVRRRLGEAALDLEVGLNATDDMARAFCSEALIKHASSLLDLSAPLGLLRENAAGAPAEGVLELRHRSAQATAIYGGSTDIHRNLVAEQVLRLPRHRSAHATAKPTKKPSFRGVPMQITASSPHCRTEEGSGIIRVTFTRDDKRNAVSPEMFDAIDAALIALEQRDDLRVMVIRAEGRFFTAGVDIAGMQGNLGEGTDGVVRGSNMRSQYKRQARHDLFDRLEQVEKPVVLAVQGPCLGVGIEFGSSCDFRIASDAATFALPEIPNLAVIPGSGGVSRLTRLVGPHWAKWMVMSGRTITAQQALNIGFVHEVHPAAEFDAAVDALATTLAGMPREALGIAKVAVDAAADVDRRTAREFDRMAQTLLFASDEYRAKVDAFMGKK